MPAHTPSSAPPGWALYHLTAAFTKTIFRQVWRAKIWLIIIIYFLMVVAITQLAPTPVTGPEDKVRFALSVCVTILTIFAILLAVFMAGTHLPRDIESKTIFTVLTKPVGRVRLIVTRLVGFWITVGLLLVMMAAVGWAVVWLNQLQAGRAGGGLVLKTERPLYAHDWQVVQASKPAEVKPTPEGLVWVKGDLDRQARFRFPNVVPARLAEDGKIQGECRFTVSAGAFGVDITSAQLMVSKVRESPGLRMPKPEVISRQKVRLEMHKSTRFSFPADRLSPGDTVLVSITRDPFVPAGTPDREARVARTLAKKSSFAVKDKKALYLLKPRYPFLWNYAKSVLVIGFGCVLMCSVATMGSTFLSAAVSIVFSFFIYFCGNLVQVIQDISATLRKPTTSPFMVDYAPSGQLVQTKAVQLMNTFISHVLTGLQTVVPDFRRFSTTDYLLRSFNIPAGVMARALLWMLFYSLFAFAVACLCMWKREAEKS